MAPRDPRRARLGAQQSEPEEGEDRLPGAGEERREPAKDIVRRKAEP